MDPQRPLQDHIKNSFGICDRNVGLLLLGQLNVPGLENRE
jgi:hypothetical protein